MDQQQTTTQPTSSSFKADVAGIYILGILFVIFGAFIAYASWPETTIIDTSFLDGEPTITESGSGLGAAIGIAVAFVGQMMLAVAVIATGVRIGTVDRRTAPEVAPTV